MGYTLTNPRCHFFDATGAPLSEGYVYTYQAGTSTKKDTFLDSTLTTTHTNPIVLDAAGSAEVWAPSGERYKIIVRDSDGATVSTSDNYSFENEETVPDYAALRAVENPAEGDERVVSSPGIAGRFIYDPAQAGVDDGGVVISGWVRQFDDFCNVQWWEVTPETTALTDQREKIQKALDYIAVSTGPLSRRELYFPPGQYGIADGLLIDKGFINFRGTARRGSSIVALNDMSYMLRHFKTDGVLSGGLRFTSIRFDGNDQQMDAGVWLDDFSYAAAYDFEVREVRGTGLRIAQCEDYMWDVHIHKCGHTYPLEATGSIDATEQTLTTSGSTPLLNGDKVVVYGAGVGGSNLETTVNGGAGTSSLTLADEAITTVSGAAMARKQPGLMVTDWARREGASPEWESKISNSLFFLPGSTYERCRGEAATVFRASAVWFLNNKIHGRLAADDNASGSIIFADTTNPVRVDATNSLKDGDFVTISNVSGMTEINFATSGTGYMVSNVTNTGFDLFGVDGTAFTAYTSGGTFQQVPGPFDLIEADRTDRVNISNGQVIGARRRAFRLRKSGGGREPTMIVNACHFEQPANYVDPTDIAFYEQEAGRTVIDGNLFTDDLADDSYVNNGIDIKVSGGNSIEGTNTHDSTPPGGGYFSTSDHTIGRPVVSRRNRPSYSVAEWTPVLEGIGTAGTMTYTTQEGVEVRQGNIVFFSGEIEIDAISVQPVGNLRIAGLTWLCQNAAPGDVNYQVTLRHDGIAGSGGSLVGTVASNSQSISLWEQTVNGTENTVTGSAVGPGDKIAFSGSYVVDD